MSMSVAAPDVSLEVVRVDVVPTGLKKTNLYVKIKLDKDKNGQKTGKLQDDGRPISNAVLPFLHLDASNVFSITLKKSSIFGRFGRIGYVNMNAMTLLQKSAKHDVQLDLTQPKARAATQVGTISLRVKGIDTLTLAEIYVTMIERDVEQQVEKSMSSVDRVSSTLDMVIQAVDQIIEAVDAVADIHPLFQISWKATTAVYKLVSRKFASDAKLKEVVKKMKESFDFSTEAGRLDGSRTKNLKPIVKDLLSETIKCSRFVQTYTARKFAVRMIRPESQDMDDFIALFADLRRRLDSAIGLTTLQLVIDTDARHLLEKVLRPAESDVGKMASLPRCLKGTREEYLGQIKTNLFSETDAQKKIVWLTGAAGSGKSAIAVTISDLCDEENSPAAYLFFERGKGGECSSTIRTIAYRLAFLHPYIAPYIVEAVRQNLNISGRDLTLQFKKLILEPLRAATAANSSMMKRPIVIVFDALDESGSIDQRHELLRLLENDFAELSARVRLFVTSRPEKDIMELLSSTSEHILHIQLDHTSEKSREDVERYVKNAVSDVAGGQEAAESPKWKSIFRDLIRYAGGRFISASTAVKMVQGSQSPERKLQALDAMKSSDGEVDGLYATVLEESGISWNDQKSKDGFTRVIGVVLFAREALSAEDIEDFLGLEKGLVVAILAKLGAVLSYEPGQPVRIYHRSFADYVLSTEQSGSKPWHVDETIQKQALAERCFVTMTKLLRFNMCGVESSFLRNQDSPGLEERIKARVPPHLDYACRFWAVHFCESPKSVALLDKLKAFAYDRLLYWLEILSLTKYFDDIAARALRDACLKTSSIDPKLSSFLWAAYRLVVTFAYPISRSAPQIYLSALSFLKGESPVADHYSKTHPTVRMHQLGTKIPAQSMRTLEGYVHQASSIALSPDGRFVASGSIDNTVRVWDADSGELIAGPFEGHRGTVLSVTFSPDGQRVASGSADGTIRIWDTSSGKLVAGPFEGHTGAVRSVAFSPDGGRVVSGSDDKTLRVWKTESGRLVLGPIKGHCELISSVTFSPDGQRIASGSEDKTVRIWDAGSGELVSGPLMGHTSWVTSVTFSPDGSFVVSGSDDKTIRIWGANLGELVVGPLMGHTGRVLSVVFSPDGSRISSGSQDSTIRVWDAASGELLVGPLDGHTGSVLAIKFSSDGRRVSTASDDKTVRMWVIDVDGASSSSSIGHTGAVLSVAFSPDGRQIASGSVDGTVCIRDSISGEIVSGPLKGHTSWVRSVSFSPDGRRVVSGSDDKTLCIWDVDKGELVSEPLEALDKWVTSAVFSPDGRRIVSGSEDRRIIIWDVDDGGFISSPLDSSMGAVLSVAFSPDGQRVVSGSEDGSIRIWDAESCMLVSTPFRGHNGPILSVAFSPDGHRIVSGSVDETIRIWGLDNSAVIVCDSSKAHTSWVRSVSFSPDGYLIVSASDDKTIRIWNAWTGELVFGPFEGHTSGVRSVSFSPDGHYVVSGSHDQTIRVWKVGDDIGGERRLPMDDQWTLKEDGWVLGMEGELITWIPEDMRGTLWRARNTAVFNCRFSTRLDLLDSPLGDEWTKGIRPHLV